MLVTKSQIESGPVYLKPALLRAIERLREVVLFAVRLLRELDDVAENWLLKYLRQ